MLQSNLVIHFTAWITPEIIPLMVEIIQISIRTEINKKVIVVVEIKITTEDIDFEDNLEATDLVAAVLEKNMM